MNVDRRLFFIGLIVASAIGAGILGWLLKDAQRAEDKNQRVRIAVITLQTLAELVQRAGSTEENVAAAVSEFAKQHPSIRNIRVVRGTRLVASTVPGDVADKAAPRRLSRDEKAIYDLGQKLRAAIQTNREEGVSRKEELQIDTLPSGGLLLSAPFEMDGSVSGYVQIEAEPGRALAQTKWIPLLIGASIPAVLFLFVTFLLAPIFSKMADRPTQYRMALGIISIVLLVTGLILLGRYSVGALLEHRLEKANEISAQVQRETAAMTGILQHLGFQVTDPLTPSRWDVDVFRRPLGLISDTGAIDQNQVRLSTQAMTSEINRAVIVTILFCVALLSLIGFGVLSRLFATFVQYRQAYAYTIPAMAGMIVLVFFPFLYGITLSFTGSTLYNTDKSIPEMWIGFQNYKDILSDFSVARQTESGRVFNYSNFYWTFLFTIIWTVSNVAIGVTLGLILALILNTKGLAMRPLYRVLLIFPWAMPNYITALIWKGMFHQQFGVINQVIQIFGGEPISWFQKPLTSFLTALATNGWLSFPFMMVVSLGALQSIPADLYEAARVDGATKWQQFRSITLPSLKPSLIPAIILSVVWTFNMFNIIYLVTQGEPGGSTEILITQAYKIAFEKYRYGYAAAYSTVIFMILLIYGTIQNRVTKATEAIAG